MGKIKAWFFKPLDWIFDNTIGRRFANASLETQVEAVKRMMGFSNVHKVRRSLLIGIPKDIRGLADKGMTAVQIKDYYWGCEPFRDLWCKTLQMEEATFDEVLRGTLVEMELVTAQRGGRE